MHLVVASKCCSVCFGVPLETHVLCALLGGLVCPLLASNCCRFCFYISFFFNIKEGANSRRFMLAATLPQTLGVDDDPHCDVPVPDTVQYRLDNLEIKERSTTFSPKTDVSIGRDAAVCSLVFPETGTLSRVHCKIFSMGRDVFVLDMSSNGTFVNGKVVGKSNRRVLRSGDVVSLMNPQLPESTKLSWRFVAPEDPSSPTASATGLSELERLYELGPVLGTGNFATVRLGTHRANGRQVAVKIVEKKRFALQEGDFSFASLQSEVEILRKMNHRNIIGVWDSYDDAKNFTMVLELVAGGDLFDYIVGRAPSPFTEDEARSLFVQLLEAMLYMHDKDVVHRDLKPENILVHVDPTFAFHKTTDNQRNARLVPPSNVTLKITDFGLAKFCTEQDVMTTMCGTPVYLAPEVLYPDASSGKGKAQGYSWSVDVWSLGVILYVMLSGCLPKDPQSGKLTYNKHMADLSSDSKNLMEAMLRVDPRERADLSDIVVHPWLKGCSIELRHLAVKKDRLVLCGTVLQMPLKTVRTTDNDGTITDVESDDEAKPGKRPRLEASCSTSSMPQKTEVIWFWKKELSLPDSDTKAWQAYALEDCERIEKARLRDAKSAKVGNSNDYRISLEGMFQYSTKDPTKQRPVKRVEV